MSIPSGVIPARMSLLRSGPWGGRHHDGHDFPISRRHMMRVDSDWRDDASSVPASSSLELIVPVSFDPELA